MHDWHNGIRIDHDWAMNGDVDLPRTLGTTDDSIFAPHMHWTAQNIASGKVHFQNAKLNILCAKAELMTKTIFDLIVPLMFDNLPEKSITYMPLILIKLGTLRWVELFC